MTPGHDAVVQRMHATHLEQVFSLVDKENWGWEFVEVQQIHRLDPESSVVALHGSEVVGLITCIHFGETAFIVHVVVKAGWRGRGIGVRMMDSVLADLDSRGASIVELPANPEAVDFYGQFSFERVEEVSYFSKLPPLAPSAPPEVSGRYASLAFRGSTDLVAASLSSATGYSSRDIGSALSRIPADLVLGSVEDDEVTAVLLSRTGHDLNAMGPWFVGSRSRSDAEEMLRGALSAIPSKRVDVMSPASNSIARHVLESCGFSLAKKGIVRVVRSSHRVEPFPDTVLAVGHLGVI